MPKPDPLQKLNHLQRYLVEEYVEDYQEGAVLPFTRHPLFGAIALPTGGTGLVFLLEYLATIF